MQVLSLPSVLRAMRVRVRVSHLCNSYAGKKRDEEEAVVVNVAYIHARLALSWEVHKHRKLSSMFIFMFMIL